MNIEAQERQTPERGERRRAPVAVNLVCLLLVVSGAAGLAWIWADAKRVLFNRPVASGAGESLDLPHLTPARVTGKIDFAHVLREEVTSKDGSSASVYYYPIMAEDGATGLYAKTARPPVELAGNVADGELIESGVIESVPGDVAGRLEALRGQAARRLAREADRAYPGTIQAEASKNADQAGSGQAWPAVATGKWYNLDTDPVLAEYLKFPGACAGAIVLGVVSALFYNAWRFFNTWRQARRRSGEGAEAAQVAPAKPGKKRLRAALAVAASVSLLIAVYALFNPNHVRYILSRALGALPAVQRLDRLYDLEALLKEGNAALKEKNELRALNVFAEGERQAENEEMRHYESRFLAGQAKVYARMGLEEQAKHYIASAMVLAGIFDYEDVKAELLAATAELCDKRGDEARRYAYLTMARAKDAAAWDAPGPEGVIDPVLAAAMLQTRVGDSRARDYFAKAMEIAVSGNDERARLVACEAMLGMMLAGGDAPALGPSQCGSPPVGEAGLDRLRRQAAMTGYWIGALCAAAKGEEQKAGELFAKAANASLGLGNASEEAKILRALAWSLENQGKKNLARDYRQKAAALAGVPEKKLAVATDFAYLGHILAILDQREDALALLDKALDLWRSDNNAAQQAFILDAKADVHETQGDEELAGELRSQAEAVRSGNAVW
jgi:hypothetical protein